MADLFKKGKSLYASTTNTFSTGDGETITPASVSGLPTDTEITLTFDRVDSSGTATPTKMERIIGTISGGNFVSRATTGRGADGTTEQAHTSPVVEYIFNAKDLNDMVDGFLVGHLQSGAHGNIVTSDISAINVTASSVTVNAVAVPTISSTSTFTNKRITQRVVTTTDDATAVIDCDTTDQYELSAIANATTFTVTGTPTDGQKLIIRYVDAGVSKGLTFTGFTALGATIPTDTTAGKWGYVGCIYNLGETTWHVVAVSTEA